MLFNSLPFLVFFPLVTLGFFLSPVALRLPWLLAAGVVFYCAFVPEFIFVLALVVTADYFFGRLIQGSESKRGWWLAAGISFHLSLLVYFKYSGFFGLDTFGIHGLGSILVPLGLSFHVFQSIAYLTDIYARKVPAVDGFGRLALFIFFYPQLVAGPIERAANLVPQLELDTKFSRENFYFGLRLMIWGFFKKIAIADSLKPLVDPVFAAPGTYGSLDLALAAFFFSIQIYGDFSGYTDIARGCARTLNIRLTDNFRFPYFAADPREFWRRWHISLSSWFRDYVYTPLGGSRGSRLKWVAALFVVFTLSGLWHGANLTFLLWGIFHFALYLIYWLLPARPPRFLGVPLFFVAVTLGWILFRAPTVAGAMDFYRGLLSFREGSKSLEAGNIFMSLALVATFLVLDWRLHRRGGDFDAVPFSIGREISYFYFLVLVTLAAGVFSGSLFERHTFIYFQF